MSAARRRGLPAQSLFGGLLLFIGVSLFVRNLGWWDGRVWQFWPMLLIAVGLLKLLASGGGFDRMVGLALVAFGALRLASSYFALDIGPPDILAGVLVVFGSALVWRGLVWSPDSESDHRIDASDTVSVLALMGGYSPRSTSPRFRGGDITVFMGGIGLDLRGSQLQGPAVLDVFVMWGGVEIKVPADWTVELCGMPILAGFEDKTATQHAPTDKRLIVRGAVIMGGIEVKN